MSDPNPLKEFEKISLSKEKSVPYGSDLYVMNMVGQHKLQSTLRGIGRPKQS